MEDKKIETTNITKNLNRSGIFLEFAFLNFAKSYTGFPSERIETQVPYTITYEGITPINGSIDFLCFYNLPSHPFFHYIIECKKADPSLKDWIFFRRYKDEEETSIFYRYDKKYPRPRHIVSEALFSKIYDRAFQINASLSTNSFNNQRKDPIYSASIQACTGLKNIIYNERRFSEYSEYHSLPLFYVPIVVTTANLYVCEEDSLDINIKTGEADTKKVNYTLKNWVEFSNAIPEYLQIGGVDRASVFIVNSQHLENFFNEMGGRFVFIHNKIKT